MADFKTPGKITLRERDQLIHHEFDCDNALRDGVDAATGYVLIFDEDGVDVTTEILYDSWLANNVMSCIFNYSSSLGSGGRYNVHIVLTCDDSSVKEIVFERLFQLI